MPSACEVDVTGVVSMYALQLASGTPSALVDWNNNYGERPRQVRLLPLRQLGEELPAGHRDQHGADPGQHARRGEHLRRDGRPRARRAADASPAIRTDDRTGRIRTYVGEGAFTDDPLDTFGDAGGRRGAGPAEAPAPHLPERLRASRGDERVALGRDPGGGVRDVPGVERVPGPGVGSFVNHRGANRATSRLATNIRRPAPQARGHDAGGGVPLQRDCTLCTE